ncbi:MAG: sodium:proton antiporter [Capsulimonadaceae bacterium]|nr:sodium:proton antiporter [Capsulimonadaceae bacterium]
MILAGPDAQTTILLLFVASIVAIIARRMRLPTTVGLLVTGFGLALFGSVYRHVGLNAHTLTTLLLPPLIFEGALNTRWRDLKRDLVLIVALTTVGVVIACFAVALIMKEALGWSWRDAMVFGALIAATDPIAVLAMFKFAGIEGRPKLLLEAESLLNDGTAVVLYSLLLAVFSLHAMPPTPGAVLLMTLKVIGGSLACGIAVGWCMTIVAGRASDALTETTLTTVAAFGAYYLAERIQGTGILASLAAGLVMGNAGMRADGIITERGQEIVEAFWDFAAFVANSLVFLLMGMSLAHVRLDVAWQVAPVSVAAGLLGRALTVYGVTSVFGKTSMAVTRTLKHLLFWGGQRGGLSLVLALSYAATLGASADRFLAATVTVVTYSVIVQGLTFAPLLTRLNASQSK